MPVQSINFMLNSSSHTIFAVLIERTMIIKDYSNAPRVDANASNGTFDKPSICGALILSEMKIIVINSKKYGRHEVLIDEKNYSRVINHPYKWGISKNKHTFYCVARGIETKSISLHRFIMNTPKGVICDHEDHNGLNCQEYNLRNCTHTQNNHNKNSQINSTSKYIGVYWHKGDKKWRAVIVNDGKKIELGRFEDENKAAIARNEAAIKYHGKFAKLNIITN